MYVTCNIHHFMKLFICKKWQLVAIRKLTVCRLIYVDETIYEIANVQRSENAGCVLREFLHVT